MYVGLSVVQVTVGQQAATGSGPNKKLAKRAAAEALLQQLGYSRPALQPGKPAIRQQEVDRQDKGKKVGLYILLTNNLYFF